MKKRKFRTGYALPGGWSEIIELPEEGVKMKVPNCSICKKRPTEYELAKVYYNDPDANGIPARTIKENLCIACYEYIRVAMKELS